MSKGLSPERLHEIEILLDHPAGVTRSWHRNLTREVIEEVRRLRDTSADRMAEMRESGTAESVVALVDEIGRLRTELALLRIDKAREIAGRE